MKRISYLLAAVFSLTLFFGSNLQAAEPPKEPILQLETQTHSARVSKIAVDKNGRILASASYDKTVRIWDLRTGKLMRIIRPPINERQDGELYALALSPDGKTIACGGYTGVDWQDRAIYFFDVDSGNLKKRITGITGPPLHLEFSKDGKYLAALFPNAYGLNLYRTSDHGLIGRDTKYNAFSNSSIDFAPSKGDDTTYRFVTTSRDGHIRLYEIRDENLKLVGKIQPPGGKRPQSAKFSPDGTLLAVGFFDTSRVDIISGKDLAYISSADTTGIQNRNSLSVAWSADGNHLYAGGMWGGPNTRIVIRKWADRGRGAFTDSPVDGTVMQVAALPEGGVAFGTYYGSIGIIDRQDKRTILAPIVVADFGEILISHDARTVGFKYSKNSKAQFLFSLDNHVLLQDTSGGQSEKIKGPVYSTDRIQVTDWNLTPDPKVNEKVIKIAPYESSRCYTIVPSKNEVLHGSDRHLRLLSSNAVEKWRAWLTEIPISVNVSGDGKVAVAALGNGIIQWFRMEDGKKLLSFFPHNDRKRWVVWTEGGYYDASENADELIGWHVNRGVDQEALFYPLARFFEKYYRPEVIDGVMIALDTDMRIISKADKGKKQQAQEVLDLRIKPPPKVTMTRLGDGKTSDNEEVKVKVIAEDMGGGIDDIWLFHNGKRVMEDEKNTRIDKKGTSIEKIYNLRLLEGENYFSAAAFNKERVESEPAELMVVLAGVGKTPDLHLVLIGVDKYKNPTLNLGYAGLDAKSMEDFFVSDPVKKLFGNTFVYRLMNDKVTKNNIIKLFEDVKAKALQKDAVILYMAGHGDVVGDEWFLIPHDVTTPEDEKQVKSLGLSTQDIIETLKGFKAQKVLVVIDACKSGGVISGMGGLRGYEDRKVMKQLVRSTGTYVISASNDKQFALELKQLGHGVFTFTMLEGLKGKAGEKKVTVEGLIQYVKNRLPELSEKYRGNPQWPVSWGAGMDFPLALY